MHDTVTKVRKRIREGVPEEGIPELFSVRLQGAGLSRALSEPLSVHLELLYLEAFRWLQLSDRAVQGGASSQVLGELVFSCRHLQVVLQDLIPFLERAEDSLSEKDEITHRESSYEREVAPFSRLDSTQAFRGLLASLEGFTSEVASAGAQAEADLLKVVYLESRLRDQTPKPVDLYAMVVELVLDSRRHLHPAFDDNADFMKALTGAARTD